MTRKVCVIGSSYIGAVYRAYKANLSAPGRYDIDFYGHSHGGFSNAEIVDGEVRNVRFKSPGHSVDVREYDAFVIYGDLPAPHDLAKRVNHCVHIGASQQLMRTLVKDVVQPTTAVRLADTLVALTGKPVLMVSGNVVIISKAKMKETHNALLESLFDTALAPHIYLPFPRAIFDEEFLPDQRYYNGSVHLTGEKAEENTGHDNHHMNEHGGLLILNAIMDRMDQALMSAAA